MFKAARIKLTIWYLLTIMLITVPISILIFVGVDRSTRRALEGQRYRIEREFTRLAPPFQVPHKLYFLDTETLLEIRSRTLHNLVLINAMVLIAAGFLGYFLSGKTLEPIEQMVEKQKRFISDAAHEIKTPLTAMRTGIEVSLRDKEPNVAKLKEILESTVDDIDRLHKFTSRLLHKSKYQNYQAVTYTDVDLADVLERVSKRLAPLAKIKHQKINLNVLPSIIKGNAEELEELFTNIVDNALRYNKDRGHINIHSETQRKTVQLTVEDFGIGIHEEDIKNIFEPFYRADKSRTSSNTEGYGLGLAIAKEIVEKHHGNIRVESVLGKGSKFIITFPLSSFSV